MLNPKWLANAPDDIVELWQESEDEALKEIARQISSYDYFTSSAMHQKKLLSATGATQKSIISALSKVSGKSQNSLLKLMQEAGNKVVQDDTGTYKTADIYKADAIDTEALNAVLRQGTQDTLSEFRKIIQQSAVNGSKQVYNCIDRAQMLVSTGVISQEQAVKDAIKTLADHGLDSVVYTDNRGHISQVASLETAVRRAVQTGVNQTAGKISMELAKEVGCDLVEVSAHSGARLSHAMWQGKIYSISGMSKRYPKLSTATGYGTITGLCGINCRHTFGPWVEGSNRVYTDEQLADMTAPCVKYNGEDLTEYEASQIQRKIERTIRKWKREEQMLDAAGLDSSAAHAKVEEWRARSEDFSRQTGMVRQYERENVWSVRETSTARPKATRKVNQPLPKSAENDIKLYGEAVTSIPDQYVSKVVGAIEYAPESARAVWMKCSGDLKAPVFDLKSGAHFNPIDEKTHYESMAEAFEKSSYQDELVVYFHEYGHNIDFVLGGKRVGTSHYYSSIYDDGAFGKMLAEEAENNLTEYCRANYPKYAARLEKFEKVSGSAYDLAKYTSKKEGMDIQEYMRTVLSYPEAKNAMTTSEWAEVIKRIDTAKDKELREIWTKYLSNNSMAQTLYKTDYKKYKPAPSKAMATSFCSYVRDKYTIYERGDISDMYEGYLSKEYSISYPFGVGHGKAYHARSEYTTSVEAFAEMHSATYAKSSSLGVIKEHFPKTYQIFLDMMEAAAK